MTAGSPLDTRALELNVKRQWRVWAGRFSSSAYAAGIDIEYNAIRNAAALLDISPLYSYRVSGPDATHLVDRVITRDATRIAPGQVIYTPWCDEDGKVIDDGTVARLDDDAFRWTAADPQLRWLRLNARGLDVTIEETSDALAAIALQGPLSRAVLEAASGADLSDLGSFRRRTLAVGDLAVDVSRTGYTGDLGYELWIDAHRAVALWDALMESGRAYALRPAGIWALDVARIEAGLIMLDVDYTASTHASTPDQRHSPAELGLGRLVDLVKATPFTGRTALLRERDAGGPARRLVGLELDREDLERLTARHGLTPSVSPDAWRSQIPVFAGGRQIGRATSGTWSPTLKKLIALASVEAAFEPAGTPIQMEWTVEGVRERIRGVVAPLPFYDPAHKRT